MDDQIEKEHFRLNQQSTHANFDPEKLTLATPKTTRVVFNSKSYC